MRLGEHAAVELDDIDLHLLDLIQEDCRTSLVRLGEQVGLSAPAVLERMKKLEAAGIVTGYHALVDGRRVGLDITAFIGVLISHPTLIGDFERQIVALPDVLECHHVTGEWNYLLKVRVHTTAELESLITNKLKTLRGVARSSTVIVLTSPKETAVLPVR